MERLTLDVNGAFDPTAGGLSRADLDGIAARAREAFDGFEGRRKTGELGFADLAKDRGVEEACRRVAARLQGEFDNFLTLGIGGSSLGARAVVGALCSPLHNLLPREKRRGLRMFFPDNSDPATMAALFDALDLERTCWVTISKSGGTAETMAQHMALRQRAVERFGEEGYRRRCVFVTDPKKGVLRQLADAEKLEALPVPPSVGGRFSVLSAVGLLPAAAAGADTSALLDGAAALEARCRSPKPLENPALLYACTLHLLDAKKGRRIDVLMPYCDALRDLGDWFVQLWAESLGKNPGAGPTPVRAVGATDQHSSLQLMMEGPHDKVVTFVHVEAPRAEVPIPVPGAYAQHADLAYLKNHTMGELLDAERRATAAALRKNGRPSVTIGLPRVDARGLGELLMFLELAAAYAGGLYGVNAFDQPGVEAGKIFAQGLLGRPGYEKARAELEAAPARDPALVV